MSSQYNVKLNLSGDDRSDFFELLEKIRNSLAVLELLWDPKAPVNPFVDIRAPIQVFVCNTALLMHMYMLGNEGYFRAHPSIQNALKFLQSLETGQMEELLTERQIMGIENMISVVKELKLIPPAEPQSAQLLRNQHTGRTGLLHSGNLREQQGGMGTL